MSSLLQTIYGLRVSFALKIEERKDGMLRERLAFRFALDWLSSPVSFGNHERLLTNGMNTQNVSACSVLGSNCKSISIAKEFSPVIGHCIFLEFAEN